MEVGSARIDFKDTLRIKALFDCHIGASATDEQALNRDIKYILDTPDCYTFIGGDMVDAILRTDIKRFMAGVSNDEIQDALDDALNIYTKQAIKKFKPLADAGKILFAIAGNHEVSIQKHHQYNIVREICDRLDIPFMGYSCLFRLTVKKNAHNDKHNYIIYAHHGFGGGRKPGSSINNLMSLQESFEADAYFMGHDHKSISAKSPRFSVSSSGSPRLLSKDVVFIRGGSYLKTYLDRGRITYSEQAGYPPVRTGGALLELRLRKVDRNNRAIESTVID
jgi:hypothetical protein